MNRIVWTRPDDGVSMTSISPALVTEFHLYGRPTGTLAWRGEPVASEEYVLPLDEATAAAEAFVIAQHIPRTARHLVTCVLADLPSRRFRNCWRQAGAAPPHVDMPLARLQRLDEVRAERGPKLALADIAIQRATDAYNVSLASRLRDYRQALRDLPEVAQPEIEALTTPEALAAWEPAWPVEP